MLIRLVQFVWHIRISDPITIVWYVKVDIKLLQFCRGYFQKTFPFVHMYFYSNFTEVFSKVSFVPIEITFTCTKYCLTQWISKLPWVSQNLINLTSGGHIKRNCLRDRANYRSSRAWQIVTRQPMMTSSNKYFPRNWLFVRESHRSPVNSLTKASDAQIWCFLWSALE